MNLNSGLLAYIGNGISDPTYYYAAMIGFAVLTIVAAYLLGSINSAILISRLVYHDDVRNHGSKNAGTTNMLRTYGKGAALMTLAGDMLKTVAAIFVAGFFFGFNYVGGISTGDGYCYVAGLFAVLGHIFPIYYKFKGGKGVLSTATMALVLTPVPFAFLLLLFVAVVAVSKYVSLGSVTVAVLYPVAVSAYFKITFSALQKAEPGFCALSTILIAILIVWCHRENLSRISNRTEHKLSFGKKKNDDEK